jgi:ubiquinol-cytochrome c reductase cytochrome b subunit
MNEEFKKKVREKYEKSLRKGEWFWPDSIYKDLIVSFAIFLLLIGLATFIGVHPEPKADPTDTSYIPRPEWYFLFLFQFLKYFPGSLEWVGAAVIPGIAVLILILLPFIDKNPYRHYSKRKFGITVMTLIVIGMVVLTGIAVATTPPQEEVAVAGSLTEQIAQGQDLYSINCVECHGPDGEGGVIQGVEGLEGFDMKPINSHDEMYTRTDEALANIISYGQPDLGMQPFGSAYGGELSPAEVESIVTFMRYTWDDRAELPPEAANVGAIPTLGPDEVPSYEEHIQPIVKRYCISCHRPGKQNNNYMMGSYDELLHSGDHADKNIIAGDESSYLIQVIRRQEILDANGEKIIGVMPPTKALKDEYVDIFVRWIMAGMPETAEDAAALSGGASTEAPTPTPAP